MKLVRAFPLLVTAAVFTALAQEPPKPAEPTKPAEAPAPVPSKPADAPAPAPSRPADAPKPPGAPKPPDTAAADSPKSAPAPPSKPHSPAEAMRQSIERQRAAIGIQREAARKQAESAGAWLSLGDRPFTGDPDPFAPIQADCDPLNDAVLSPLIDSNAKTQNVKPEVLRAVMERESGYRPCAVSRKGAEGLMQLMPATAQELGVTDVFDPKENVGAGARLLRQLMDKYNGDLSKALAAYNAGPAAVDEAGGIPDIQETKDYVDAILRKLGITPPAPPKIQTPKPIEN